MKQHTRKKWAVFLAAWTLLLLNLPAQSSNQAPTGRQETANGNNERFTWIAKQDVQIFDCDFHNGVPEEKMPSILKAGFQFYVEGDVRKDTSEGGLGDYYVIKICNFLISPEDYANRKVTDNSRAKFHANLGLFEIYNYKINADGTFGPRKYFAIRESDLEDAKKIGLRFWTWRPLLFTSPMLLPVKVRPGGMNAYSKEKYKMQFETNVSIGMTIGAKFRMSSFQPNYISLFAGGGLGTTVADSTNTNKQLQSEGNQQLQTIFTCGGIMLEFNNLQLGFTVGADYVSNLGKNWDYQGKPWIGFGLGYDVFKSKDEKAVTTSVIPTQLK